MNFDDLKHTDGADEMGGTQLLAYVIPKDDVETMPDYPAAPSAMSEHAVLEGSVVPKAGKQFFAIEAYPTSGKLDDELIEGSGNAYESTYEFMFPGMGAAALGFAKQAPTTNWVAIVIENDGTRRLMGIKTPALIKQATGTTGLANENNKGITFQVKSWQSGAAPIYEGTIDNDSGSGSGI
jgi:hypothetical protein